MEMDKKVVFNGIPESIKRHSLRHAEICRIIGERLELSKFEMEILETSALAHDIGGALKDTYKEEQKALLRMEFEKLREDNLSSKPSFNPQVCIEHAKERIRLGLRGEITEEEKNDPFPLYLEEFQMLKGEALTEIERELLRTWWYHPQFSIDVLQDRGAELSPEVKVLIRCNEQPWLIDSDKNVLSYIEEGNLKYGELKRLLSVMRAADIIENGNNKERRELRGVAVEDYKTTLAFLEHKFNIDGLEEHKNIIEIVRELFSNGDREFLNVILSCREEYLELKDEFEHADIASVIENSFDRMNNSKNKIMRNGYDKKDEYEVLYDNLWYKFSFVPERRGDFDKLLKLEEAMPEPCDEMDIPHLSPKNRACPFCNPNLDEILGRVKMPSNREYTFLANIAPYATNHMVMAGVEGQPQMLSQQCIVDLLHGSYALGCDYEGSFTSFSGASMKHWHGQYYKVKTPIWKNLQEGRVHIVNRRDVEGVQVGELSNWPARSFIIKGKDSEKVAAQIWKYTLQLMEAGVPYNTKFMYCEDGNYVWLLAPRTHGFMTYVEYFLEDENAVEPEYVSGCGSIESPGGDVIMFFDIPELSSKQKELMAKRFAKSLRETSDWEAQGMYNNGSLQKILKNDGVGYKMAHRIESVEEALSAVESGYHMVEVDVQLTKDNRLIAMWGDVENKDGEKSKVFQLTYDEIMEISSRDIMDIEELCHKIQGKAWINFDIKDWSHSVDGYKEAVIERLIQLIEKYNLQNNAVFEAFNTSYTEMLRKESSKRGIEVITGAALHPQLKENEIIEILRELKDHKYSSVFIYPENLTKKILDFSIEESISVFTSSNDSSEDFSKSAKFLVEDIEK